MGCGQVKRAPTLCASPREVSGSLGLRSSLYATYAPTITSAARTHSRGGGMHTRAAPPNVALSLNLGGGVSGMTRRRRGVTPQVAISTSSSSSLRRRLVPRVVATLGEAVVAAANNGVRGSRLVRIVRGRCRPDSLSVAVLKCAISFEISGLWPGAVGCFRLDGKPRVPRSSRWPWRCSMFLTGCSTLASMSCSQHSREHNVHVTSSPGTRRY